MEEDFKAFLVLIVFLVLKVGWNSGQNQNFQIYMYMNL